MLPSLDAIRSSEPEALATALSLLFEPSPVLDNVLEPRIRQRLKSLCLTSYTQLIDLSLAEIHSCDGNLKSQFIGGHPRIGENKNLSKLSTREQASTATKPEVLARLAHLNECYEQRYPQLRYITFVNGRTRAVIAEEMEDHLGLEHSLSATEPALEQLEPLPVGGEEWLNELERAIRDIGYIAKSRLKALGEYD